MCFLFFCFVSLGVRLIVVFFFKDPTNIWILSVYLYDYIIFSRVTKCIDYWVSTASVFWLVVCCSSFIAFLFFCVLLVLLVLLLLCVHLIVVLFVLCSFFFFFVLATASSDIYSIFLLEAFLICRVASSGLLAFFLCSRLLSASRRSPL